MEKASGKITEMICRNYSGFSEQQAETIKFGLECILGEATKTIIYLIIFSLLQLTDHFIIAVIFFCIPRNFAGGYHANTFFQCFIISFIIFSTAVIVGSQINLPYLSRILILLISMTIVWIYAPVDHPNKPIISADRRKKLKVWSLIVYVVMSGTTFILNTELAATAAVTLLLEAVSLPIGLMLKRSYINECT